MFQRLLEERFALKLHRETHPFTAYALTVAKNGPKLKETQPGAYKFRAQGGHAEGYRISMPMLAARLSRPDFRLDRQVVDLTGLKGVYDLNLMWSPEPGQSDDQPSFFTALEEQLGLKLELRKNIPLEVLIVDHADRAPVEN